MFPDHPPLLRFVRVSLAYWVLLLIVLSAVCIQWPLLVVCVIAFRLFELWFTYRVVNRFTAVTA
ncbi:hypothetical protein Pan44_51530 [Caulifigura coniformis]|uniref:Phosphatidate cytidylyltransferase n=2 Tax=Caulifigura coniformis TaxID=2527983 RepID=A0A517SLT0_9PLAN|nr:hypothetical protein Pan44_51530 [Caulifigura coniformis]